jgi:hypothetical protein
LLPVCRNFMADGCIILVDDIERPQERKMVHLWIQRYELSFHSTSFISRRYTSLTVKRL